MPIQIYPKQNELIEACRSGPRNIVLASGPRMSSKTVGVQLALCERAWYLERQRICILSITQSVGTTAGVWDTLINTVLPQYMQDTEMVWVDEPHNEGTTKIPTFSVSNRYGGVTKFNHMSLKDEAEVEDRFKGPEFTTIFVNELSKFYQLKTFTTLHACLRGLNVPEEDFLFVADTNPSDEGDESWIHNLWYRVPNKRPEDLDEWEKAFKDKIRLVEFTIDDNLGMSAGRKQTLYASLAHDDDLLQRYWYGRWVKATKGAVFSEVFRPHYHVIGEIETRETTEPEVLVPEPDCVRLCTSWDPGSIANWAMVIGEIFHLKIPEHRGQSSVKILDEHVVVKQHVDYVEFVKHVLERMAFWEEIIGRDVLWTHYADRSVWAMQELESRKFYAELIFEASDGRIELEGVERPTGSLQAGIDLMKLLMHMNRFWVSKTFCPNLLDAIKGIKAGKTAVEAVERTSKFKHVVDAVRYLCMKEFFLELNLSSVVTSQRLRNALGSSVIAIPR